MDLNDLNFRNPINIGYYDPFNVLPIIREDIESKWPITNLHWKYYTAKSVKSIPLLPVTFVEEIPRPSLELCLISDDRYIRMMFVKYDNVESYRSQVRPLIREWLRSLVSKSNVEWLIVLVIPTTSKYKQSTLMKTSMYDKLRNDFGVEGKELIKLNMENIRYDLNVNRCFRVNEQYESDAEKIEIFSEFTRVFKEALIRTFNNKQTYFQSQLETIANRNPSNFESFLIKLNYAKFMSDIRLLKEAEELYANLTVVLPEVCVEHSNLFDMSFDYPQDINNFRLEYAFNTASVFQKINSYNPNTLGKLSLGDLRCLLFINQSAVLQSLANLANTISISALYISNLYRNLLQFIDGFMKIVQLVPKGKLLDHYQFLFAVIECYLKLPISQKVIEVSNANNINNDDNISNGGEAYQLNEIYELKGELKLIQRSILNDLGYLFSYQRTDDIMDTIDFKSDESSSKYNPKDLIFEKLVLFMKDNDTFFDAYEQLTESAIQDFLIAGRNKTIDVLSIDLVIIHYKRGNYRLALDVLQDSYGFFIEHRWKFMGGMLLEIYIDCKEKLGDSTVTELITPNMKLLSLLSDSDSEISQRNINCFRITKSSNQVKQILEGIIMKSKGLSVTETYPLNWIFSFDIKPFIHPDFSTTLDKYYLDVDIKNSLGIDVEIQMVSIVLRSMDNDTSIELSSGPVIISAMGSSIRVFTNEFKLATFVVETIGLSLTDNIKFFETISGHTSGNDKVNATVVRFSKSIVSDDYHDSIIHQELRGSKKDLRILFYQCLNKFWCEFSNPSQVLLGSSELILTLHNQHNVMKDVTLKLQELTAGLNLNQNSLDSIKSELLPGESYDIIIPYSFFSDSKLISIGCEIDYKVGDVTYKHIMRQEIDITLTVSVSVQDIFKPNCLFLNFQISTANSKFPVNLKSCEAHCNNDNYTIQKPKVKPNNVITFGEQPVSVFYRILLNENYQIQLDDKIDLCVVYTNLRDECIEIVQKLMRELLNEAGLINYWFVFVEIVSKQFRFDLNHYAINKKLKVLNALEVGMLLERIIKRSIEKEQDRKKTLQIMKSMLTERDCKQLEVQFALQSLTIPVSIPTLKYLHQAKFEFTRAPSYLVGEPIKMKLEVKSFLKWSAELDQDDHGDLSILAESSPGKDKSNGSIKSKVEPFEFTLSIPNDSNWLVSGFRKKTFLSTTSNSVEIILIPLTVGKLHLPRVLIKLSDNSNDNGVASTMEVEVANGAETLLVLSEQEVISFAF